MDVIKLLEIYISLSNKLDTYWTAYIIVTGTMLSLPIPQRSRMSYIVPTGYCVVFLIYSFINDFALSKTYASMVNIGSEIELNAHEVTSKALRQQLCSMSGYLDGSSVTVTHVFMVLLVISITAGKAWHQFKLDHKKEKEQ